MVSYCMLQLHQYVWFGSCLERISGMPTLLDLTTRTCKVFKRSKSTRLCLKRLWVWIDSPCSRHLYISTSTNASERLCKIISLFSVFWNNVSSFRSLPPFRTVLLCSEKTERSADFICDERIDRVFLAVQDSSIGDIVSQWVSEWHFLILASSEQCRAVVDLSDNWSARDKRLETSD